jgi:hypothetical protein
LILHARTRGRVTRHAPADPVCRIKVEVAGRHGVYTCGIVRNECDTVSETSADGRREPSHRSAVCIAIIWLVPEVGDATVLFRQAARIGDLRRARRLRRRRWRWAWRRRWVWRCTSCDWNTAVGVIATEVAIAALPEVKVGVLAAARARCSTDTRATSGRIVAVVVASSRISWG